MREDTAVDLHEIDHDAWGKVFDTSCRMPAAASHPRAYGLASDEISQALFDGIAKQTRVWKDVTLLGPYGKRRSISRPEAMRVLEILTMFDRAAWLGYGALRRGAAGWIELDDRKRPSIPAMTASAISELGRLPLQRAVVLGYFLAGAGGVVGRRGKCGGVLQHVFALAPGAIDRPQHMAVFVERPIYKMAPALDADRTAS
ncbi:hypothetical protein [Amorphus sp. 3PC139-8]|uniref:hypothetical protein n=1 Tax=Amorphus sp. 3PC139-8 TaxID=2735676 RepID=UPI00345C7670